MSTTLAEERDEQRRWHLRPEHATHAIRIAALLDNEFVDPGTIAAMQGQTLSALATFAAQTVPYWAALFRQRRIDPRSLRDIAQVAQLPILGKAELIRHRTDLRASRLPRGERLFGWFSSSGTTGQPAKVLQTQRSNFMFTCLRQRQYRWHRFDPAGTFASIRLPGQLPSVPGEGPLTDGAIGRRPSWRYAGTLFETGPYICFGVTSAAERQLAFLADERPDYLETYSETLEHLAFACDGHWPAPGLRKLLAISEQLTPSMRRRIEATVGAPIEQGYGLNEIGLVGVRCAAGRYHVHAEHCLLEIVDDDGQPCAPGAVGRVVITGLSNTAMPLFRYDTGDLASAAAGTCPCGRTLPSFGDLVGRYSRIAYLPEGTLAQVGALREALEAVPPSLARNLRQFQVHQYRDRSVELRLLTAGELPDEFAVRVRAAWTATTGDAWPLAIRRVDAIARSPGGKFQDFTSDFMPRPDRESDPPPLGPEAPDG